MNTAQQEQSQEFELSEQEVRAQTQQNKCSGCGSNMAYDIETGGLKCKHCGTTKEFNDHEQVQRRKITNDVLGQHQKWQATVSQC